MAALITLKEATEVSGYHPVYMRRLLRSGRVIGRKYGIGWYVDKSSLLFYMRNGRKHQHKHGIIAVQ